ncbi:hypothetical protein [Paenibacillus sp. y28]|uniref:hypothetical protein n=1 Tax=Paenibacillus sp. y28 TaxID=3129110 RepID=UPI0030167234
MNTTIQQAMDTMLRNWNAMSGADHDDAEPTADEFQSSFYAFIDELREWLSALEHKPQTLDELLELPEIQTIVEQLPAPLHLNFETEAELILDNQLRIEEDKYD